MANQRGFIFLFTFVLMMVLTMLVGALLYITTYETRDIGYQMQDEQLLNLAEAGVQKALRVIRDDVLTTTQTGTAEIRGADTSSSVSVGNSDRMRYEEDGNATINANSDEAILKTFDTNYANTRITNVSLGVRASRGGGGTGATIEVSYSTNGVFPQVGNTVLTQALTTSLTNYSANITADHSWTWETILTASFTLRAVRTAGNRDINLDYLFLTVTYEIDTNTESWFTGSYEVFPINLGSGTIQSISITAEQGKVHLNTASQSLLRYLMVEHGVVDATANTVATSIVSYRGVKPFDNIEELLQVSGMTTAIFDAIKSDVTVYSFINSFAQDPAASRAPVNINTASREVLEAIFDPLTFNNASDITSLVSDIITQRSVAPFTAFYTSDALIATDFYDFVRSRGYLNNAEDDRVLGNADASFLVPREGGSDEPTLTTEFCYDTNAFKVESLADIDGRRILIKTILGDDGSHTFTTYSGDPTSVGYHKESFE